MKPQADRAFWSHVDQSAGADGCWPWMGATRPNGYGNVKIPGTRKTDGAHRRAYILSSGLQVPDGLVVRHRCDNPPCCNPNHLLVGTRAQNMADAKARGRMVPPPRKAGSHHHKARLTEDVVRTARKLRIAGVSARELAGIYGVAPSTMFAAVAGRTWRDA